MTFSIGSNLSALNAFGKGLGVTANNIANIGSKNFEKSRAINIEGEKGQVETEISKPQTNSIKTGEEIPEDKPSNVELTEEIPRMMIDEKGYQANLKVIQTQDEMLGSVLDIIA